jgi:hypothetical protein
LEEAERRGECFDGEIKVLLVVFKKENIGWLRMALEVQKIFLGVLSFFPFQKKFLEKVLPKENYIFLFDKFIKSFLETWRKILRKSSSERKSKRKIYFFFLTNL